jgi:outer membrane lipoprotein SlyB
MLKMAFLTVCLVGYSACTQNPSAQHEVACVGGSLTGAVIGGAIGNRFGGGSGQTIATAAGAFAGGAAAARRMNC